MATIVTTESIILVLLVVLVAGLLRSHADILRSLHDHGILIGNPSDSGSGPPTGGVPVPMPSGGRTVISSDPSAAAPAISGVGPAGDVMAIGVSARPTLLAFLSSGCRTCLTFWAALGDGITTGLGGYRLVVVTMGPDRESPAAVAALQPEGVTVLMSTEAWDDYGVPGSPYFVAIADGRVTGQGSATTWEQLVALYGRAAADTSFPASGRSSPETTAGREVRADRELAAAGIEPGHPSLYPTADGLHFRNE